ncbi:MAG: methyltransferase regulatory domain-containing protein [Alphaproteobacteria bacterium]|nr:methyltransferase regulatory domain-containing protein [Alphaproteobacteria bacterium]
MSDDAYDVFPYGTRPFPEAHPDRMYVAARAFGRDPVPPERARILDLGCGEGGHLAPLAVRFPDAVCVGLDRSHVAIEGAKAFSERIGAKVTWLEVDLLEAMAHLKAPGMPEQYDYILAHGVFSWVPDPVRDAMLGIIAEMLAPQGVAYLSYNCRPGWHLRGMVAEIMRHHVRGFDDPAKKVSQARAILQFLSTVVPGHDPYGAVLRREAKLVARQPDFWVFHDLLAEENRPFLLSEFVTNAATHGLAYLGDADLASMMADRMPPEVRETLEPLMADVVQAEQYQDFLICRNFRRSLLVRPEPPLTDGVSVTTLHTMCIRGRLALDPSSTPEQDVFKTRTDDTLEVKHPLVRAALRELTRLDGVAVPFTDFLDGLCARVPGGVPPEDRQMLARNLTLCWVRGGLDFHVRPLGDPRGPSERPVADPLVRAMAPGAEAVTSLFHEDFRLDGLDRDVLPLLDGTRSVAELLDEIVPAGNPIRDRVAEVLPERFHRYWAAGLLTA